MSVFGAVVFFIVISVLVAEAAVGNVTVKLPKGSALQYTVWSAVVRVAFAKSNRLVTFSPVNAPVLGKFVPIAVASSPVVVNAADLTIEPASATKTSNAPLRDASVGVGQYQSRRATSLSLVVVLSAFISSCPPKFVAGVPVLFTPKVATFTAAFVVAVLAVVFKLVDVSAVAVTAAGVTEPIGGGAVSAEVNSADVISPAVSAAPTLNCLTMKPVPPVPDRLAPAPPDATPIGVDAVTVVAETAAGVVAPITVLLIPVGVKVAERVSTPFSTARISTALDRLASVAVVQYQSKRAASLALVVLLSA